MDLGIADIVEREGLSWEFAGDAAEERAAMGDTLLALGITVACIYIIMAWVFSSYFQPFLIILTIPLGFVGAVYGLWANDYALTFLAWIAMAGLSGIVVNDSIILVSTINELKKRMSVYDAIVAGAAERLRAVLLTSTTTIGGLTPLLFETSRQAQFLIPMAIVMVYGLAFATFVVLFFVPALTAIASDIQRVF